MILLKKKLKKKTNSDFIAHHWGNGVDFMMHTHATW